MMFDQINRLCVLACGNSAVWPVGILSSPPKPAFKAYEGRRDLGESSELQSEPEARVAVFKRQTRICCVIASLMRWQ